MIKKIKTIIFQILRWSEKYTKTDMLYLTKGGFWLGIGQITSSVAAFALSVVFANLVSPEVYGTYRYILSICGLLAIPTLPGMATAITQAIAKNLEGSFIPAIKTKIKWGTLSGLGSIVISIYYFIGHNQELTICFLIAALFLPIFDAFASYDAVLSGKKDFRRSTLYFVISQIIASIAIISAIALTKNLYIIIGAYFVSWTAVRVYFFLKTLKKYHLNQRTDDGTISYGIDLSLMGIIGSIANYLDKLLLYYYLGPTEVAIYSIAIAPPEQLKNTFKNINVLAFPKYSEKHNESNNYLGLNSKLLKLFIFLTVMVAVYIIFAPLVYQIFFPKYINAVIYSQIFSLSLLSIVANIPLIILQARTEKARLYFINTTASISQIILLFIFIKYYGIMGAILARVASRGLIAILLLILVSNQKNRGST